MITKEIITIDRQEFQRTVSDTYMIRKVGTDEVYSEAVDLPISTWTYEETNILLDKEVDNNSEDKN